jgi:hypothetical protein
MDLSFESTNASLNANAVASSSSPLAHLLLPPPPPAPPSPSTPLPCDDWFPGNHCLVQLLNSEERFLSVMSIILACAVCALIVLVMVMSALIHKLSAVWLKSLTRPPAQTEPSDDPRKGLLHETKSSLRNASDSTSSSSSSKTESKKKKKTSFAEDTSCAPPRDVDEEDL